MLSARSEESLKAVATDLADWLEAQPQSPTKDDALAAFSSALSRSNPSLALDWADSITETDKRSQTVGTIVKNWYKKDPKAAAEFINSQQ